MNGLIKILKIYKDLVKIIVKTMNGSIEMFIDSPIAFLFYGFIFFVFGYGLYYIGYIFNKNKNSKIE